MATRTRRPEAGGLGILGTVPASKGLQDLFTEVENEFDMEKRYEAGRQFQEMMLEDPPMIMLFVTQELSGIRDGLEWLATPAGAGIQVYPYDQLLD